MTRTAAQWRKDLLIGTLIGLGCSATFSLLALVRYLASPPDFEKSLEIGFAPLIRLYWLGGLIGGVCIAVLRPLRNSTWGSFTIGFVAGLPLATGVMLSTTPRSEWYPSGLIFVVLAATLEGGGLAVYLERKNTWTR